MQNDIAAAMRRALASTRAQNLAEATQIIQAALGGSEAFATRDAAAEVTPPSPKRRQVRRLIDPDAEVVAFAAGPAPQAQPKAARPAVGHASQRPRKPLGAVIDALRKIRLPAGDFSNLPGMKRPSAPPPIPDGAQYLTRSFTCAAGTRSYQLYIPASAPDQPRGLVVMLHGCKQDPDDFAAGTNMNAVAEANGLMVAYPCQEASANPSACWNWFSPADQMRDAGEPAILAGMTQALMAELGLGREQVFIAGLSAGGAMAAVMGETYPDIYAAVGIHSGLPHGSAHDVVSAFAAMRGETGQPRHAKPRAGTRAGPRIRTIVFHGDADRTVHPSNAARIVAAASANVAPEPARQDGRSAGGRPYTRTVFAEAGGAAAVESWLIHGAGHAWSGGHASGSYTDPQGPDASAEMIRFFLTQPVLSPK